MNTLPEGVDPGSIGQDIQSASIPAEVLLVSNRVVETLLVSRLEYLACDRESDRVIRLPSSTAIGGMGHP